MTRALEVESHDTATAGTRPARTDQGVMALYLASLIDPHYMVRDAANDALGVLLVCRRACFKDVFAAADDLAKQLKGKYKPGGPDCGILFDMCQSFHGGHPAVRVRPQAGSAV